MITNTLTKLNKSRKEAHVESLTDKKKTKRIQKTIRYAEKKLRRKYSILQHQNAIGMTIFITSIAGMVGLGALYIMDIIPAWACIVGNGIFASLLHELEHDLIHQCYFKDNPVIEKIMFYGVWMFRGNTPNPYFRTKIHRLHHRESGNQADIEERFITNGMKWSPLRLWFMFDQRIAGLFIGPKLHKEAPDYDRKETILASFPFLITFYAFFDAAVVYNGALLALAISPGLFIMPEWATTAGAIVNTVAVVWMLPNLIRQFSIQFISSNMHYYGDFDSIMLKQTQVLNKWYLFPFHLFCFNFGSTHGIHHFVVNQPFYIRQMAAPLAHASMKKYGVRFNDLGTFKRANRYYKTSTSTTLKQQQAA